MTGDWFVYDDDPIAEWGSARGPILYGPFATREAAEAYANASHPDDGSGSAVVLQAEKP